MKATTGETVTVEPVITYPRNAVAGSTYLMTIDLHASSLGSHWPYEHEEFVVNCELASAPFFSFEPVGDSAIVLHRFGGTYGPARFLLTANDVADGADSATGSIWITLTDVWGIPFAAVELPNIGIVAAHANVKMEPAAASAAGIAPAVSDHANLKEEAAQLVIENNAMQSISSVVAHTEQPVKSPNLSREPSIEGTTDWLGEGTSVYPHPDALRVEPSMFMSYDYENDHLDGKFLTYLQEHLESEIASLMGRNFKILRDHRSIQPGHIWEERLEQYLSKSAALLPILTPQYFTSEWCRKEFEYFRQREQKSRRGPLIFPIYYIESKQTHEGSRYPADSMEYQLSGYQYADWRMLGDRGAGINGSTIRKALRKVAKHIVEMFNDLESESPNSGPSMLLGGRQGGRQAWPQGDRVFPSDLTVLPRPRAFFGRSSDIDWVIEMLTTAPLPHIAALDGAQGIGKTTVAAEAVLRLYADARFPGGIAVVPCKGMTDPHDVLRHALIRFDPERRPPAQDDEAGLAEKAHRLLSAKQALIVLDGIETRLDITRVIEPLSRAGAALLLTSKRPLPVAKARRRTLAPLQIADALDLLTTPSEERRPPDTKRQ